MIRLEYLFGVRPESPVKCELFSMIALWWLSDDHLTIVNHIYDTKGFYVSLTLVDWSEINMNTPRRKLNGSLTTIGTYWLKHNVICRNKTIGSKIINN